jgi:hypothetical protein
MSGDMEMDHRKMSQRMMITGMGMPSSQSRIPFPIVASFLL